MVLALRGMICFIYVILGPMWETRRVSIIDPLENSKITAGDGRKEFSCEMRERYSLNGVGLILTWRLIIENLSRGHMVFFIIGLQYH